jgi:hypothetical protein
MDLKVFIRAPDAIFYWLHITCTSELMIYLCTNILGIQGWFIALYLLLKKITYYYMEQITIGTMTIK